MSNLFLHTLKLLIKGKETLILLLLGFLLLLIMLLGMDEVKEEKSKIVIGIVDEDKSALSGLVMENIRKIDGYEAVEGESDALLELLSSGELSSVCVIQKGYEEAVAKGRTNGLVMIYDTGQGSPLLSDVLASAMIEEICSAKGYLLFAEYMEKKYGSCDVTLEEYQKEVASYLNEDTFAFSFDIMYYAANEQAGTAPGNEVIYVQAIFAIAALMMGFVSVYALMPYHRLCHGRIAGRAATLPFGKGVRLAGSALAGLAFLTAFAAVFLLAFVARNRLPLSAFLSFLVCTLVYSCVIAGVVIFAGSFLRSAAGYQMGMLALVLVFGIFGLVSIVDGLLLPEGVSTWVPNGWYVRKMMEIYQK